MKRYDFPRQFWALSGILVGIVLLFGIAASAQAPSIEGTYQLHLVEATGWHGAQTARHYGAPNVYEEPQKL